MTAFKWILTGAVMCVSSTLFAGESNGVIVSHYEPLQRLSIHTSSTEGSLKLGGAGPVSLSFDALGRSFDLQLESNAGLLSAASRDALPDGVAIYHGRLAGQPDSWARIVVYDGMPRGLVWDGAQMFAIEAPGDSVVRASSPIIYRLADTFIEPGTMSCGTGSSSGNGAAMYSKLIGELGAAMAKGPGSVSEINFGAIGDFEFTDAQGSDALAAAAITARLNAVDGIFSAQLGVQINIQTMETFSNANDPFTDTNDAIALLVELATYRLNTPAQSSQGLTHMYTGRALAMGTAGIAYIAALCHPQFGAGLTTGTAGVVIDSLITAHEIGHNFGAPHDSVPGPCETEPMTFIMAPIAIGSSDFSACSITEMADDIAAAACITPLPSVDMSVTLNGQLSTVLLGNSATLTFDVSNNGTLQATNVEVDVTLPNNVSFVSVATSSGSCTNGAGTVNCVLGDVSGISLNTVTVATLTTAVGVGMFDATVTADIDERPSNNQDSVQLTVDPAVDLVVNTPAAASINLDQSTTDRATLENRSILDATGVTLSISLNNGLSADTATWSIGTCIVAAQQVDCTANNFANQSNSTLNVGVTGTSAGVRSYSVTLSSNEADADPADNSVIGSVTVSDPNARGSSGGGATGLPFIWLLGWAIFVMRRHSIGI